MRWLWAALSALTLVCALPAQADQAAIGRVKTLEGSAAILRGESRLAVAVGSEVRQNDVLETAADSSLGITFRDETRMSIGPDTRIRLDRYAFQPEREEYSLIASITRGTLFYISGLIAKLSPESAAVVTPGGTIGMRGTRFVVRVKPG